MVFHKVQAELHREEVSHTCQPHKEHDLSSLRFDSSVHPTPLQPLAITALGVSHVTASTPAPISLTSLPTTLLAYVNSSSDELNHILYRLSIHCGVFTPLMVCLVPGTLTNSTNHNYPLPHLASTSMPFSPTFLLEWFSNPSSSLCSSGSSSGKCCLPSFRDSCFLSYRSHSFLRYFFGILRVSPAVSDSCNTIITGGG